MRQRDKLTAETIKGFRLAQGLSQQELASLLGVGVATVSRWETGETSPTGTAEVILTTVVTAWRSSRIGLALLLSAPPLVQSGYAIYRLLRDAFEDEKAREGV